MKVTVDIPEQLAEAYLEGEYVLTLEGPVKVDEQDERTH